ncbi:MAG: hypothetical protein LBU81_00170 [Methanosarcinales archaeon]|jgi:hypothetical protein|nr:hypothetical protein [Methanosarcinales archaeon]
MIQAKSLIIFFVLSMFLITGLSVCAGDDSTTEVSIYNSTDYNPNSPAISIEDTPAEEDLTPSIYNSTGSNPANDSANNPIADEPEGAVELIEYEKVPIDAAYSRDKLQNINVSDNTLESFSRFGLWLEEQGVDAEAEDINVMYIDDDLRSLEGYWVFATRPESKEMYIEILQNSKSENVSPDEMISFLKNFDEKYPVKYVRTGLVLFITVENKEALLSEISEEDKQTLKDISDAILEEASIKGNEVITSNWGSENPNMHGDMAGWAAEKAGFDPYYADIISDNAAEPDFFSILPNVYERNYKHYYNPDIEFGGAPESIDNYYNNIGSTGLIDEKYVNLSYASHYMADLSMPLHTNYASQQAANTPFGIFFGQPHFAYENDYVGANWTSGHNFSRFAKDVNSGYLIQNPGLQSKDLADYAYSYSDDAWRCGFYLTTPGYSYTPTSSEFYATAFSIDEGQRYLIGLMHNGHQLITTAPTTTTNSFTNQEDITLQLSESGLRAQELDLTDLRVSIGAGDSARIYINGNEILKFIDSSAGGNLYVYNENGNQLGSISKINGKPSYENMTFDISFIHDGSEMTIEITKYYRGALNGTFSYSYMTNTEMSEMRANMTGYQSNVDYISSEYEVYCEPSSGSYLDGSFENQQDITLQFEESGFRVQEFELTDLRVSMGAGDSARIYINYNEILKFVDSAAGGSLYVYNENGNQLGSISKINGKPSYENMTFDISFIHDGSEMNIEIKKYYRGALNGTFSYSYMTNTEMSEMRANMTGYQSNVDYISSDYGVYYEPLTLTYVDGSFENQQDKTLQLEESGLRVQKLDLTNLRVSMGAGDIARIYINDDEILKFVDSAAGGNLYIYNTNGNQLGSISEINGKPSYENMTFGISFTHDGSEMMIYVQKYFNNILTGTFTYSYPTTNDISMLRANMTGYQSNVDYISGDYGVYYQS